MNDRTKASMFGIDTIEDYLAFCAEAVSALKEEQASVLKGFSAVLALNHLPDWLQYKLTVEDRIDLELNSTKIGVSCRDDFEADNSDLTLIRSLANGLKHLRTETSSELVSGFGQGPYGIGPYGKPYLSVDRGESSGNEKRYVDALTLCENVLACWQSRLISVLANENDEGSENHE